MNEPEEMKDHPDHGTPKAAVKAVLILAFAVLAYFCFQLLQTQEGPDGPAVGSMAPEVGGTSLDGEQWKLVEQRGKVVMIDFWATWCPPCRASLPQLAKLHAKYAEREDFVLVGVALDEQKVTVRRFCEKEKISWPQLFEPAGPENNQMAAAFGVRAIPSLWIIDRDGSIAAAKTDLDTAAELLEKLLAETKPKAEEAAPPPIDAGGGARPD